jgi:hypothetical protein
LLSRVACLMTLSEAQTVELAELADRPNLCVVVRVGQGTDVSKHYSIIQVTHSYHSTSAFHRPESAVTTVLNIVILMSGMTTFLTLGTTAETKKFFLTSHCSLSTGSACREN